MSIFCHHEETERLLRELLNASREEIRLLRHILKHISPPKRTQSIELIFSTVHALHLTVGGSMAAVPGTVAVGGTLTGTIVPLEADGITQTPSAVVSGQSYTVDNTSVVSVVTNADGSATFTGVSAGSATVTATATVTDSDGTVGNFTTTNSITVTQPTEHTASIQLNFR